MDPHRPVAPWGGKSAHARESRVSSRKTHRPHREAIAAFLIVASSIVTAHAEPECMPAGSIARGLAKLVTEFHDADHASAVAIPVEDFLVGVSDIPTSATLALARRGPVAVARRGPDNGVLRNDGQEGVSFTGMFAGRLTYFQVPQHIRARYDNGNEAVTLYYDAGGALRLGEAIPLLGVPLYRSVNHVRITRGRLLFFWGDNTGDDPDRCYVPG